MNMASPLKISCGQCRSHLDVSDLEPFSVVNCPVCGAQVRVPMRFDRYLLEEVCGSGSSTTVYRALDPQLSRRVAVKILNDDVEDADELGRHFFAEARLVAKLNHPGILPIYNCGVRNRRPFLVMRYMERGDLGEMMLNGVLPPLGTLLEMIAGIADALQYAYRTAEIVHHDVKPSNILLAAGDEARLGDFDLADVREFEDQSPCVGWGSPAYVSPERLYTGGEDLRGDVFSLGATLYELLSGRPPFVTDGDSKELYELRRAMDFPELNTLRSDLPERLSNLVSHMLDFEPICRPGYSEIIRDLRAAAASLAN